jgi:hypothetical protein
MKKEKKVNNSTVPLAHSMRIVADPTKKEYLVTKEKNIIFS